MIDRFADPWILAAAGIVPVLALFAARRTRPSMVYSDARALRPMSRTWRVRARWVPTALRLTALAALVVAVARPQRIAGKLPVPTEGIAIQIVMDRSGSMAEPFDSGDDARGAPVSKLDAVKTLLRQFVLGNGGSLSGRSNDLLGLVTFARFAETACPLSRSPKILVQLAEQTQVAKGRQEDGTAIGDGLALATARLKSAEQELRARDGAKTDLTIRGKVVILMTDGQNNAGDVDPLRAAELAKDWGIRVYTIGLAARRPDGPTGDPFFDLRASLGGGVDEPTLRQIAEVTGGRFFSASDGAALRDVYTTIDTIEKSRINSPETTRYAELFPGWAIAALAAVAGELALSATVLRRWP